MPSLPERAAIDTIETVIVPRARDLGGFEVWRALPSAKRQMVGPFIFFDEIGPAEFLTGKGLDVRPHPHTGLGTVTYLFRGRIHYRDSLGTDQWIEAGAINLMTAGQGITHSERMDQGALPQSLCGLQTWLALPSDKEDNAPAFGHTAAEALPVLEARAETVRLILGRAWDAASPVETPSERFYTDVALVPGATVPLPKGQEDRGAYILKGTVEVAGEVYGAGRMLVFRSGDSVALPAGPEGAPLVVLGGGTMEGPRHLWWNFVASSQERIEAAKEAWRKGDWQSGRFSLPPGDDSEHIPLPLK